MNGVIETLDGKVAMLVDIDQPTGFGVIIGDDRREYIFRTDTIEDYDGVNLEATGLKEGARVHFEAEGEKVSRMKIVT